MWFYYVSFSAFRTTNFSKGTLQFCLPVTQFLPVYVFKVSPIFRLDTLVAYYEAVLWMRNTFKFVLFLLDLHIHNFILLYYLMAWKF